MTLDPVARKAVLRSFSYGLFAVAAAHDGEQGIFTANWISQVSFDPPMVALSVELDASTLPLIRRSGLFSVTPLRAGQRELAGDLGRPKLRAGDKVAALGSQIVQTDSGTIAFAGGLGFCVCQVVSETPAGDSVLFIGEVIEAAAGEPGEPLTMKEAGFRHSG